MHIAAHISSTDTMVLDLNDGNDSVHSLTIVNSHGYVIPHTFIVVYNGKFSILEENLLKCDGHCPMDKLSYFHPKERDLNL